MKKVHFLGCELHLSNSANVKMVKAKGIERECKAAETAAKK
jgi:hypothetical protein